MLRAALVAIAMLASSTNPTAQAPPPPFELPAPTGNFRVGTTRWVVADPSRQETFVAGRQREVEVFAWYPTNATTGETAAYVRTGMEEVLSFARLAKLGDAYDGLANVKTHSLLDAAPAPSPPRFPVIVFSHGYTGFPSSHTSLAEDLASYGFAVLHVVHPFEAAARLSDGTFVTFTDEKNAMRPQVAEVLNEWKAEGSTMEQVVAASTDAEKEKLLRGYLGNLKHTERVLRRWVDDVKVVLDRLPKNGPGAALAARLDLTRLGAAGHSMGGVMAGQFCLEDRRCKAGLNLDGIPQYGTMIDATMPAPFMMVYSARPGRAGASDYIYSRAASKYYRADVADTLHVDFSEMNFWGGPLRQRGAFGSIAPGRAAEITRLLVREFFSQELLGQKSSLLSGDVPSGVTVRELRKP
jgi:predicted dienelactone hydrolase